MYYLRRSTNLIAFSDSLLLKFSYTNRSFEDYSSFAIDSLTMEGKGEKMKTSSNIAPLREGRKIVIGNCHTVQ